MNRPAEASDPPAAGPSAGPAELVRLERVSKWYGTRQAVRDLDLTLRAGEIFVLLGPNGAGKTTALKMTAGILRPSRGRITVCGWRMDREGRQAKRHIGYVPDEPYLYEKLTGREFLRFVRDVYGVPPEPAAQRLAGLCARLDMDGFLDQLTESYSHGMRQKLALAAALLHAPRVLILDEPILGLDPRTIRAIRELLREVADAGNVVFMSTHTLDVAEALADRIGILHRGRLVALGTLAELRAGAGGAGRLEDIFLQLTAQDGRPPEETLRP